ncbi:phosphoesterase [Lachnospiraceae bacterium TWA4]|nr:phosphoesterase [Lachnospiraceae bacterium TWA4]
MRYFITSDTHGRYERIFEIFKKTGPYDGMIHCGDSELPKNFWEKNIPCPVYIVKGNCDRGNQYPLREEIVLEGHKVMVVHGHREDVNWSLDGLKKVADDIGAEIIFYGHTHIAEKVELGNQVFVNPGSLIVPRNLKPSYAVMNVEVDRVDIEICYL